MRHFVDGAVLKELPEPSKFRLLNIHRPRDMTMSKTILIIDDSPSLRQIVAYTLTQAGHAVVEAASGDEALQRLDGRVLNLVICDLHMPGINGLEFVAKLKARHEYRFVPVLMLTTEASDTCREAGRAAGAKAWMVKPFQPAALCTAVTRLLAA